MRVPATPRPVKLHTGMQRFAIGMRSFTAALIPYVFVFGIIGAIVGMNYNEVLGLNLVFFGPPVTHILFERWRLGTFDRAAGLMWDFSLKSLKHVDYFWSGWNGAIALDVEARKIAIIHRLVHLKATPVITFIPFDKIIDCHGHIAGANTIEIIGSAGPMLKGEVDWHNAKAEDKARLETGLYIVVDEISSKKHFVSMPPGAIQIWQRIMTKMKAGELKPESKPVDTAHL